MDISQKTTFSAQHSHFEYTCPGRLCLKEDFTTDPITFISEIFNSDKLALVREKTKKPSRPSSTIQSKKQQKKNTRMTTLCVKSDDPFNVDDPQVYRPENHNL